MSNGKSFIPVCEKVNESPVEIQQDKTVSQPVIRIAVIGSAGRKDDEVKFTKDVYVDAFGSLASLVLDIVKSNPGCAIELVSGGAAYADHLAVQFFLIQFAPCSLKLYLPCDFDGQFADNGQYNFTTNPGGTMNYYHKKFSKNLCLDSMHEITLAIQNGAVVEEGGGLHGRNAKVAADADVVIAFTFGHDRTIKDGGTSDTCKKFLKKNANDRLYHVDLHHPKIIHNPAIV